MFGTGKSLPRAVPVLSQPTLKPQPACFGGSGFLPAAPIFRQGLEAALSYDVQPIGEEEVDPTDEERNAGHDGVTEGCSK